MANEYLQRTPTSTGNRKVWTWSGWVKKEASTNATIFDANGASLSNSFRRTSLSLYGGEAFFFVENLGGSAAVNLNSTALFRDNGSWFNLIYAVDTTLPVTEDRVKVYVNGVKILLDYATVTSLTKNIDFGVNGTAEHNIGRIPFSPGAERYVGYLTDIFLVDGQALTPDVFGFYKEGKGYISAGSTQATDFRPGQWVPKTPRVIKTEINRRGGFGVNGFYLPMNDSKNFGADFHCDPNSIIKLNEQLPQPRVGVATTASVGLGYTDALRTDPYAANLVLALPFVSGGLSSGFGDYAPSIKGSGSAKTITNNSSVSIANTHGYYGSSAYIDAVNYLSISSADFAMGTGDFTVEGWINQTGGDTTNGGMFSSATSDSSGTGIVVARDRCWIGNNSSAEGPSGTFWQLNQWTHIAFVRKTNTLTVFVNGVAAGITTNVTSNVGKTDAAIGRRYYDSSSFTPIAYIQDLRVYKGVAKYTGGFDVPKPYTPVGIATWRAVPDTTANNFATWNPISPASDTTFTNGNLTVAYGTNATRGVVTGTIGIAVTGGGKYYWENRIDASSSSPSNALIGVWGMSTSTSAAAYPGFTNTYGWSYYGSSGGTDGFYWATGGSTSSKSYGATYAAGDIIGVTLDMTTNNGSLEFYKNGVSQGVATTGIGTFLTDGKIHAIMPAIGDGASAATYTASINFGQNPTFSGNVSIGTFTDSNGKGLFKYQPPSGFLALCEDNLPTPAISNPGKYFKTVLYTGDGSSGRSITGIGFTPDLVWVKSRNSADYNWVMDSVRGPKLTLFTNTTGGDNNQDQGLFSFDSDGFSIGNVGGLNDGTPYNYVAWCWRAGAGTTSTNTDGSIQSVVSVNQTAGFSIVSYTGNNTAGATVGHGLGKTPSMIILKSRSLGTDWIVQHKSAGTAPSKLILNATNAVTNSAPEWNNTLPNSSTFTIGPTGYSVNNPGATYIAYCWAEIEGFSKFGSYVGNGNADGPMVWCGFRPAFVLCKTVNTSNSWVLGDSSRGSTNPSMGWLVAHSSDAEYTTGGEIDYLSNGFKIRNGAGNRNTSGETYIFAAFAESPFTTANAK